MRCSPWHAAIQRSRRNHPRGARPEGWVGKPRERRRPPAPRGSSYVLHIHEQFLGVQLPALRHGLDVDPRGALPVVGGVPRGWQRLWRGRPEPALLEPLHGLRAQAEQRGDAQVGGQPLQVVEHGVPAAGLPVPRGHREAADLRVRAVVGRQRGHGHGPVLPREHVVVVQALLDLLLRARHQEARLLQRPDDAHDGGDVPRRGRPDVVVQVLGDERPGAVARVQLLHQRPRVRGHQVRPRGPAPQGLAGPARRSHQRVVLVFLPGADLAVARGPRVRLHKGGRVLQPQALQQPARAPVHQLLPLREEDGLGGLERAGHGRGQLLAVHVEGLPRGRVAHRGEHHHVARGQAGLDGLGLHAAHLARAKSTPPTTPNGCAV
ncbi:unnamed protein product [Heterosigma akashiwo]